MKRVIIIQARMTSTRLPGKILMNLCGRPMLSQQIRRLKRCRLADEIVVATTTNGSDDPVAALAKEEGVRFFRGSEQDVLSRYVAAAKVCQAEVVVRITADCPLIDPEVTDRVIHALQTNVSCDYASNVLKRTFPRGLDAEAFSAKALERMDLIGKSAEAREHVTWVVCKEHPELFSTRSVLDKEDNSDLRWTVDTKEDFALVRLIYEALGLAERFAPYSEILAWARSHPQPVAK